MLKRIQTFVYARPQMIQPEFVRALLRLSLDNNEYYAMNTNELPEFPAYDTNGADKTASNFDRCNNHTRDPAAGYPDD